MIYDSPAPDDPLDQGDVVDGCHVAEVVLPPAAVLVEPVRVIVVTQPTSEGRSAPAASGVCTSCRRTPPSACRR